MNNKRLMMSISTSPTSNGPRAKRNNFQTMSDSRRKRTDDSLQVRSNQTMAMLKMKRWLQAVIVKSRRINNTIPIPPQLFSIIQVRITRKAAPPNSHLTNNRCNSSR